MDDLISREEAINVLCSTERKEVDADSRVWVDRAEVVRRLSKLPSAQKKGKWIIKDNPETGWYCVTCSVCGEDVTSDISMIGFFPNVKPLWDFCPYCGADMRGET